MSDTKHTPEPWDNSTALLIRAGSSRLLLGTTREPPKRDCRVLAEGNYQRAFACVNGLANVSNPGGIQAVIECAWDLALNGDPDPGRVGMLTQRLLSALEFAGAKVAE